MKSELQTLLEADSKSMGDSSIALRIERVLTWRRRASVEVSALEQQIKDFDLEIKTLRRELQSRRTQALERTIREQASNS